MVHVGDELVPGGGVQAGEGGVRPGGGAGAGGRWRRERGGWLGAQGVVPVAVPVVAGQRQGAHLGVADAAAERDRLPGSSSACTVSPVRVAVAAMDWTMTSWLVSGRPRQFMVMRENSRCSILFHLEVPGGKWQTVIASPVSSARAARPGFPGPGAVAVGPAGVGGDQQPAGGRVVGPAAGIPPAADGLDRELGGVVVGADVHPPGVRRPGRRSRTGWPCPRHRRRSHGPGPVPDRPWAATGPPGVAELADQLLLLGVDADHRIPGRQVGLDLLVDVAELGVPVRVLAVPRSSWRWPAG